MEQTEATICLKKGELVVAFASQEGMIKIVTFREQQGFNKCIRMDDSLLGREKGKRYSGDNG